MRQKKPNDFAIINEWLSNYAPKTATGYLGDIAFFRDYVESPLNAVTTKMIEGFITSADCPSPIVRKRRLTAIRGLYRYAFDKRYFTDDPAADVGASIAPPLKEKAPVVLREADVLRLLRHARNDRDYIIISLAYYVALTSSEISALNWKDLKSQSVRIAGDNARNAHIPDHLWQSIMRFRKEVYRRENDPVFQSRSLGGRLSSRQINRLINLASTAARIPGEMANTRILRASHAHHAFLNGAGIDAVRESMHHTTAKTTVRYRPTQKPAMIPVRTGDLLPNNKRR